MIGENLSDSHSRTGKKDIHRMKELLFDRKYNLEKICMYFELRTINKGNNENFLLKCLNKIII